MSVDLSALTDYAWADIAKAAKAAMVSAAVGGTSLSINGRSLGRISIEDAKSLYSFATEQADIEANAESGGCNVLVRFVEPQ